MFRFGKTKVTKEIFYAAKKPIKIWDVYVNNIVISILIETKDNSKYLIAHLDKTIRPLILIIPKISGYVKIFKDKNKSNKFMSLSIDDKELLEKCETIWIKIEDLTNIELNALPLYNDRYIKIKI